MTLVLHGIDLVVGYPSRAVARVGSFRVDAERVTAVTGPNGSGKTTLLKTLAGLLPPVEGQIVPPLHPGRRGAVFVHSSPYLFAGTAGHNVQLTSDDRERAGEALRMLGVEHLRNADVRRLSTGQRQRVAIARALTADARLLLIDEPEGGLDAEGSGIWRRILEHALAAKTPAVVVATHQLSGLEGLAVNVLCLDRGVR